MFNRFSLQFLSLPIDIVQNAPVTFLKRHQSLRPFKRSTLGWAANGFSAIASSRLKISRAIFGGIDASFCAASSDITNFMVVEC